jgi:hypothetical protein
MGYGAAQSPLEVALLTPYEGAICAGLLIGTLEIFRIEKMKISSADTPFMHESRISKS